MTDERDALMKPEGEGDLELVTRYLNQQLDPDRVAQVKQRLEEDAEFRELAAPLLLAWSIPAHYRRHPLPPGELEKTWDDFTRRTGFVHQKRKARRRLGWTLVIAALAIGLSSFAMRKPIASWYDDVRNYVAVPTDTGLVALPDGSQLRMSPDARVRASRTLIKETQRVKLLRGSARVIITPNDSGAMMPGMQPVAVETRAGVAFSGRGEFTVTVRGDTTLVHVHQPSKRKFIGFTAVPSMVLLDVPGQATPISLTEGLPRGRLVRGEPPERLSTPAVP